jgi:hypothetical protein
MKQSELGKSVGPNVHHPYLSLSLSSPFMVCTEGYAHPQDWIYKRDTTQYTSVVCFLATFMHGSSLTLSFNLPSLLHIYRLV